MMVCGFGREVDFGGAVSFFETPTRLFVELHIALLCILVMVHLVGGSLDHDRAE